MAFGLQLGIDQGPVDGHLEAAAAGRDEIQRGDFLSISLNELGRQTDGTVGVISDDAELKLDVHTRLLSSGASSVPAVARLYLVSGPITTDRPPPTDRDQGRGGGGGGWALLCTTADLYEAQIIRGALEQGGIVAIMIEPVQVIGAWMLPAGHERTPQRILVRQGDLEAARLLLMDADADAELPDPAERAADVAQRVRRADRIVRWAVAIAVGAVLLRALITFVSGVVG